VHTISRAYAQASERRRTVMTVFKPLVELTDAELDAVAAGQANGLVAVNIGDVNVLDSSLNNAFQNFLNHNNLLTDFLNHADIQVPIGIAAAVLGLAGASSLAHSARA